MDGGPSTASAPPSIAADSPILPRKTRYRVVASALIQRCSSKPGCSGRARPPRAGGPASRSAGPGPEPEPDHHPAGRELVEGHVPPHPQHEAVGLQVGWAAVGDAPAHPPVVEGPDHGAQLVAGVGQPVVGAAPVGPDPPVHHPFALQVAQALGQHRPGDPGDAPLQLVEAVDPAQHLPDQQQAPAVAEDLDRPGHRAVVVTGWHGPILPGPPGPDQFGTRTTRAVRRASRAGAGRRRRRPGPPWPAAGSSRGWAAARPRASPAAGSRCRPGRPRCSPAPPAAG
jgi:hypothetical protein